MKTSRETCGPPCHWNPPVSEDLWASINRREQENEPGNVRPTVSLKPSCFRRPVGLYQSEGAGKRAGKRAAHRVIETLLFQKTCGPLSIGGSMNTSRETCGPRRDRTCREGPTRRRERLACPCRQLQCDHPRYAPSQPGEPPAERHRRTRRKTFLCIIEEVIMNSKTKFCVPP